jgi:hypothetical protein
VDDFLSESGLWKPAEKRGKKPVRVNCRMPIKTSVENWVNSLKKLLTIFILSRFHLVTLQFSVLGLVDNSK